MKYPIYSSELFPNWMGRSLDVALEANFLNHSHFLMIRQHIPIHSLPFQNWIGRRADVALDDRVPKERSKLRDRRHDGGIRRM